MGLSTYLLWGLLLSAVGLACIPLFRQHGLVALLSGVFAAPLGLLDFIFVPEYWAPTHIAGKNFSIEGILFSFGNGVLAWPIAIVPYWDRISYRLRAKSMIMRCLMCWALAAAIIFLMWKGAANLAGTNIMTSAIIALAGCGVFILWRRPDIWVLAISGSAGFACLYLVELAVLSRIAPEFANVWSPEIVLGLKILGFPVEEIAWAVVYGGAWALAVAFGCDARIHRAEPDKVGDWSKSDVLDP